jgi:hypothetical protein
MMPVMRTTITLDDDVMDQARQSARKLKKTLRLVVNEALREGLARIGGGSTRRTYVTRPHRLGLREGYSLDNMQELLSRMDGEDSR